MISPKKSLGQNFLIDLNIIKKIVKLAKITKENILEIGPGTGNLTNEIFLNNPSTLILIEKDKRLIDLLKLKFIEKNNIDFFNEDIMEFDLNKRLKKNSIIFGNLPYNISTQILVKLIKLKNWPPKYTKLVLMFQKEVADKIIAAKNSDFGRLRVLINYRLEVIDFFNISNNCFFPKPKINSTIILFKPKKNNLSKIKDINNLEHVTNIIFSHKRKMVNKALTKLFYQAEEVAKKVNIKLNYRPNEISEDQYYKIVELYEKSKNSKISKNL